MDVDGAGLSTLTGKSSMFEHVVVALDFSPATDAILRSLPRLRELGTRRLTLVHVARVDYPVFGSVGQLDEHRGRLETMAARLVGDGFEVDVAASVGNAAGEVLRVVAERGASLILLGSRGHSRVREAFIGSVARDIVNRARTPVLLLRVEPAPDAADTFLVSPCGRPASVLFATDFSAVAEHAFASVEALARAGVTAFTLLNVDENDPGPDAPADAAGQRLSALAERLHDLGAGSVGLVVDHGEPGERILASADDALIVMGTTGRGLIAEAVLGSVSSEVVRRARGSVLLVPAKP